MIKFSLNVSLINKDRLYQGKKGKYLNCVMLETPTSEYGDYMIVEDVTKEEREKGVKGAILGNAKVWQKRGGAAPAKTPIKPYPEESDEPPF